MFDTIFNVPELSICQICVRVRLFGPRGEGCGLGELAGQQREAFHISTFISTQYFDVSCFVDTIIRYWHIGMFDAI